MKIHITTSMNEEDERNGYRLVVETNEGLKGVSFCDGEPEDANLMRDFGGVYRIPMLLQRAYNAGKNGEVFEIDENDVDWYEF